MRARRHIVRGFTLIELLVVLTVIAILAGAVLPEFAGTFARMEASSTAGRLGDLLAYCFSTAGAQQTDYRLNVDAELNRIWVTREVEVEEGSGVREYQLIQSPSMQGYELPEMVRFDTADMETYLNPSEDGTYYLQFRGDGTSDFARLRLVPAQTDMVNTMELNLNGLTGRVTIREVTLEELEAEQTMAGGEAQ